MLPVRAMWVAAIGLANAGATWIVATWVVQNAVAEGFGLLVPSATVATLALSLGGLWGGHARLRTGIGIGLLIGVLVHPLTWYLALLVAFVSGTRSHRD